MSTTLTAPHVPVSPAVSAVAPIAFLGVAMAIEDYPGTVPPCPACGSLAIARTPRRGPHTYRCSARGCGKRFTTVPDPTQAIRGSAEKLAVLQDRAERRVSLHARGDRRADLN